MADELISQKAFAELIGVSSRTVFNLRAAGLDEHCEVNGKSVRVRVPDGVKWYVRHKEAEAAESGELTSLQEEELAYARLRTEEKRLEVGRKKGELVELAAVERWVAEMLARASSRLDALPLRIAQTVNGKSLKERKRQATDLVNEVRDELRLGPMEGPAEDAA